VPADNLPARSRATPSTSRAGVVRAATSGPPLHSARALGFSAEPGRDHWWRLLDDKLKARIADKVGPKIEWWAYYHPVVQDRPYAVVFGPDGLAVTTPTVSDAGRPAQLLEAWRFVPSSVRHAIVRQQPSHSGTPKVGASSVPAPSLALTEDLRGFLGNLPAEAQARLQAPFVSGDQIRSSDFFYEGTDEQLDVWCYIAGSRTVTFVSGRRVAPAGAPPHAASWQVMCRQAEVASR
jgi:hypothetical protein